MKKQVICSLFALLVVGQLWAQNLYTRYERMLTSVSYTHLTLPTILRV